MAIGSSITAAGFTVLLHCAWAVTQYRDMLKLSQQEFTGLPNHLQLELVFASILALVGGFMLSGNMKPLNLSKGAPSMDFGSFRPSFVSVNHRGRALPQMVHASPISS